MGGSWGGEGSRQKKREGREKEGEGMEMRSGVMGRPPSLEGGH